MRARYETQQIGVWSHLFPVSRDVRVLGFKASLAPGLKPDSIACVYKPQCSIISICTVCMYILTCVCVCIDTHIYTVRGPATTRPVAVGAEHTSAVHRQKHHNSPRQPKVTMLGHQKTHKQKTRISGIPLILGLGTRM